MEPSDTRKLRRPKRRWWQILCRAAAVAALALAGAYVTLPWWAPTRLIKDWLAAEMARQMDVDVQIDGLSLSWASGMEISGLKIGSTGDTGPEPMAEIDRVRMDFSPIDLFIHDRVEWMELDRPRFSVRYGPDGSLNVERLTRLDFEARAERITQRKGVVTFSMPGRSDPLQLEVTDLQVFPGKTYGIGRVTMAA
ncbi:MAG TPA: hypothetical protein VM098_10010, partial [Phycisphaerae bacterium]|nr:hypothetical protein [Phycisphaerae bacterium]